MARLASTIRGIMHQTEWVTSLGKLQVGQGSKNGCSAVVLQPFPYTATNAAYFTPLLRVCQVFSSRGACIVSVHIRKT